MNKRTFLRALTVLVQIILAIIVLLMFTAFAMQPTQLLLFTNALILVMIMVQLYTINVLTDLYEKLEKVKIKR
ncbi:MAG: hypothetical protein ACTSVB_11310 [Candidatus Heimdallarchaeaceae archaeon]